MFNRHLRLVLYVECLLNDSSVLVISEFLVGGCFSIPSFVISALCVVDYLLSSGTVRDVPASYQGDCSSVPAVPPGAPLGCRRAFHTGSTFSMTRPQAIANDVPHLSNFRWDTKRP